MAIRGWVSFVSCTVHRKSVLCTRAFEKAKPTGDRSGKADIERLRRLELCFSSSNATKPSLSLSPSLFSLSNAKRANHYHCRQLLQRGVTTTPFGAPVSSGPFRKKAGPTKPKG